MVLIAYHKAPSTIYVDSLKNYIEHKVVPGSFLLAVLANDLYNAILDCPISEKDKIKDWVYFVLSELPEGSFGSYEDISKWTNACQNLGSLRKNLIQLY